jgi:hypothetical protein
MFPLLLLAICTSVFYGVLLWTVYLALEPFVRRHWPRVLVSWTSVLSGRASDAVVGRDVLIGVALGVWFTLLFRTIATFEVDRAANFPGEIELLLGLRSTVGVVLQEALYAIRNVLLYFFILFILRMLLRRQWAAVVAFTAFFTLLNALGNDEVWVGAAVGLLYFGTAAFVIVRFGGLLAFVVGAFVSPLLFDVIITRDSSAWYFGNTVFVVAVVVALAIWRSTRRQAVARGRHAVTGLVIVRQPRLVGAKGRDGFTRAARRAGRYDAASETDASTRPTITKTIGSDTLTPASSDRTRRPRPAAAPIPSTIPASTTREPSPITMRVKSPGLAPSAIRTPISCVRRATVYDNTP